MFGDLFSEFLGADLLTRSEGSLETVVNVLPLEIVRANISPEPKVDPD